MGVRSAGVVGTMVAVFTLAAAASAAQRSTADPPPSLLMSSLAGQDNFNAYCAPCHGRDGTGHGPVAEALKAPPADLSRLTSRNHGTFPRQRVVDYVANGTPLIPAHGSTAMPVWGPTFRSLGASDKLTAIRIANVVTYVESIQQ